MIQLTDMKPREKLHMGQMNLVDVNPRRQQAGIRKATWDNVTPNQTGADSDEMRQHWRLPPAGSHMSHEVTHNGRIRRMALNRGSG